MAPLLRKELAVLWSSPLPYVVGVAFHVLLGLLAVDQLRAREQAVFQPVVPLAAFLLVLCIPLLTMRSFADEFRTGTFELLVSIPVGAWRLATAKWLAAWLTALAVLAPVAVVPTLLALWGSPDLSSVAAGFTGLALASAALTGLGVFASALTSSQPVAAMAAVSTAVVLWLSHLGPQSVSAGRLLAAFSLSERLRMFAAGGIDTGDVAFFVAGTIVTIAAAVVAVETRMLR